jgi:hypothetical protein
VPLPQTRASIIDALGRVRQTISDLKRQEARLRASVEGLGAGLHQGTDYIATNSPILDARGGYHVVVTRKGVKQ